MAFTAVKRLAMNHKFHRINKHYKTDPVVGERAMIQRSGKDPVEVLFYYPRTRTNMPVFVEIHGGAWIGLDAVDDDKYCRRLADELDAFVVNVNYKRLYERPFPYQQEEAADVVRWLLDNAGQLGIDPERIVISGGSAGGHIAAGVAVMLEKSGIKVAGQLLEVPFLDFTEVEKVRMESAKNLLKTLFALYPSKIPLDSDMISPGTRTSDEQLKRLAPAVIIVCGRCPLHEQGQEYAERLRRAGTLVDIKMYENGYHGFGTEKAEEMPEQYYLREDCFWYKVAQTRNLFERRGIMQQ